MCIGGQKNKIGGKAGKKSKIEKFYKEWGVGREILWRK